MQRSILLISTVHRNKNAQNLQADICVVIESRDQLMDEYVDAALTLTFQDSGLKLPLNKPLILKKLYGKINAGKKGWEARLDNRSAVVV